jgi:hypothetical protein
MIIVDWQVMDGKMPFFRRGAAAEKNLRPMSKEPPRQKEPGAHG